MTISLLNQVRQVNGFPSSEKRNLLPNEKFSLRRNWSPNERICKPYNFIIFVFVMKIKWKIRKEGDTILLPEKSVMYINNALVLIT